MKVTLEEKTELLIKFKLLTVRLIKATVYVVYFFAAIENLMTDAKTIRHKKQYYKIKATGKAASSLVIMM